MTEQKQSFTYHSLHRHVQSIIPQNENKDYPTIYSSNKQPQLPSILSRSRQRKSHEKSLKKGISRVSKSKKDLNQNPNAIQTKQIDTGKSMISKGTLLNFNINEVIENKYHLTKPKDEINNKSPLYTKIKQQTIQKSAYEQGQKSFISQYRIVTYVPPGYMQQKTYQSKQNVENFVISKQLVWDKQNNLNESNIQRGVHKKNDSQQIQIRNPIEENNFQLNTWRTSQNYDPYYSKNYKTQLNKSNLIKNESSYVPFQQRYSIPLTVNVEEVVENKNDVQQLKGKIRHLQHEIIDIERQKESLKRENQLIKEENTFLKGQHKKMQQELQSVYPTIASLQEKVKSQQQEIRGYQHQLSLIQQTSKKLSQSQLYQQQQPIKNYQDNKKNEDMSLKIEQLQILNAKLSKQLLQKNLTITQLNRKNHELSDKLGQVQRSLNRAEEKLDDKEEQLMRKNQTISQLDKQIQNLKNSLNKMNENSHQQDYQYISIKRQQPSHKQSQQHKKLQHQFQQLKQQYEQLTRNYNHLQKKNNFMKDELQHLKYLQNNGTSSYRSITNHNHINTNKNDHDNGESQLVDNKTKQSNEKYEQYINQLETRLEITQQNMNQTSQQYSNLKQNFRALQQLYIKQQQQFTQTQQQLTDLIKQNKNLRIELTNMEEISNVKTLKLREQNQTIKLIQKDQVIIGLKRELNSLEMDKFELIDSRNYLRKQLEELNQKYLKQVEKNTQFSIRYKEDIAIYTQDVQKQQQQKTSLIVLNYETLITKLNQQISYFKQQIQSNKDKHLKELIKLEDLHKIQLQKIKSQRYGRQHDVLKEIQLYQNRVRQEKMLLEKSHRRNIDVYLNEEIAAKKQFQVLNKRLQQEINILQIKYKKLFAEKENVEEDLKQNLRKITLYEQDIAFLKSQKDISTKQKLQLSCELQRVNTTIQQLRKVNSLFQQERFMFNRQLDDMSVKYTKCIKENENFIDEVKALKKRLTEKQYQLQNYDSSLRELRIALLQEKQVSEKRLSIILTIKIESQNHRSKEEYYKAMYEKTQRQLQLLKQQNSLLMLQKEKKSLKSSPIKALSPVKNTPINDQLITADIIKDRETQLYRIEIYKDLNTLLNLTLQNFTLEQILQKNQQQYLRKLFNAIKQDHDKLLQLKLLIVTMEEGFKQQKVLIKQDYDVVYEKYLKYKSMSQAMEKDIEKYKLKLKKKDENFASIKI